MCLLYRATYAGDALHIYAHYGIVYLPNKGFERDIGTLMIYTLNSDGSLF
jgi:hypothetical protein